MAWITVFSQPFSAAEGSWDGYSIREPIPIAGAAGSAIRVTLQSLTTHDLVLTHCGIGRRVSPDATVAPPVEMIFPGYAHGVTIAQGPNNATSNSISLTVSDPDNVLIILDVDASSPVLGASLNPGFFSNYYVAGESYNLQSPGGTNSGGGTMLGVVLIEVNDGAVIPDALFAQACM